MCVVNDGGAPIAEVMQSFAARHPHLEVVWRDLAHQGQVRARAAAIALARGDYLAFCDDDDRWLPGHVHALLAAVNSPGAAGLAFTDAELVFARVAGDRVDVVRRVPFAWCCPDRLLRFYNPVVPSSLLIARTLYERTGGLDPAVGHYWDWDLVLSAARHAPLRRVAACYTLYLVDIAGESASSVPERMRPDLMRLIAKHGLGNLPSSNFARMADDPVLAPHRAQTRLVWDGAPDIW